MIFTKILEVNLVNKKGFTLIELMVILLIISILMLLIFPNINRARIQGNHTHAKATLSTIGKALESYSIVNGEYPTNIDELLTANPPYINRDYFIAIHRGYEFNVTLTGYTYSIVAEPISDNMGKYTFEMTTGLVLNEM